MMYFYVDFNTRFCILYKWSSDNHGWYPSRRLFTRNIYEYYVSEDYLWVLTPDHQWSMLRMSFVLFLYILLSAHYWCPWTKNIYQFLQVTITKFNYARTDIICLLIQRKRTGFCILFTNSSFHTLVGPWRIFTKDIYEFLQVTITKLNCARTDIYLFVTHMDSREQKIIHFSFHTVVRIIFCFGVHILVLFIFRRAHDIFVFSFSVFGAHIHNTYTLSYLSISYLCDRL